MFFAKPSNGPDAVGGVWPMFYSTDCRNRTGEAILKGQVAMLAFAAAFHEATAIATNDANSYIPGASNDTVWNTVVDPRSNLGGTATNGGAGVFNGGVFGVALEDVATSQIGEFCFFGIVDALVKESSGSDGAQPGQILGVTSTNHLDCHVTSNRVVVGFYLQSNDTTIGNTTAAMKRVFLTNGMFLVTAGSGSIHS